MKKILNVFVLSLLVVVVLSVPTYAANAKVTALNASASGSTINVSGSVESTMVAAAISVYDEAGTTLVALKTTPITDANTFSDSVTVSSAGIYTVRVADYDGGAYSETKVKVATATTTAAAPSTAKAPKTAENPIFWVAFAFVGLAAGLTAARVHNAYK